VGVTVDALEDPWQIRLERLRRLLPLPLLAVSTLAALAEPGRSAPWSPADSGLVAAAAAIGLLGASGRFGREGSARFRAMFGFYTAVAGVLVWVDPWFGVFAYTGNLLAYGLGARWRKVGFAATALVVAAAEGGGYPSGRFGSTFTYLVIAVVNLVLVINSSTITIRMLEQHQQRGRIIDELAESNRRLEATMAENAGLHAQLLGQAREAGIVEERQRLAGEIHDTLAQGLVGVVAQLEATQQARHDPPEWSRHLSQALALARSSLIEARRSVRALRPEQLEDASLVTALTQMVRVWSERALVAALMDTTGTPSQAAGDTEAAVFRVAQEALSNVAKHAHASKVHLTLTYLDDTLILDVADDGTGFDPAAGSDGYGLVGMRQRLARVAGTLTVESAPGQGTTLNATVPLGACR
jgi:signal transduction histidine kinase